jgi:hypothetical protein
MEVPPHEIICKSYRTYSRLAGTRNLKQKRIVALFRHLIDFLNSFVHSVDR